jgi:hypothetical protein
MDRTWRPVFAGCLRAPPLLPCSACLPALPGVLEWCEPAPRRFAPVHAVRGSPRLFWSVAKGPPQAADGWLTGIPDALSRVPCRTPIPDVGGPCAFRPPGLGRPAGSCPTPPSPSVSTPRVASAARPRRSRLPRTPHRFGRATPVHSGRPRRPPDGSAGVAAELRQLAVSTRSATRETAARNTKKGVGI